MDRREWLLRRAEAWRALSEDRPEAIAESEIDAASGTTMPGPAAPLWWEGLQSPSWGWPGCDVCGFCAVDELHAAECAPRQEDVEYDLRVGADPDRRLVYVYGYSVWPPVEAGAHRYSLGADGVAYAGGGLTGRWAVVGSTIEIVEGDVVRYVGLEIAGAAAAVRRRARAIVEAAHGSDRSDVAMARLAAALAAVDSATV